MLKLNVVTYPVTVKQACCQCGSCLGRSHTRQESESLGTRRATSTASYQTPLHRDGDQALGLQEPTASTSTYMPVYPSISQSCQQANKNWQKANHGWLMYQ